MKEILARYLEVFPSENQRLEVFGLFLRETTEPAQLFHRKNFNGHITASGFVLSADCKKLALVNHKFLQRYLQPGGHVEATDENVLAAAQREILEETGIEVCAHVPYHADPLLPVDIDTHEIPANPKKNEPKHWHHDFRFVFRAGRDVVPRAGADWIWRPVEQAIDEETFKLVLCKLQALPVAANCHSHGNLPE